MPDDPQSTSAAPDPTERNPANVTQNGGANLDAQGDVAIGGDVVGRDKITNITNIYQATPTLTPEIAGTGLAALAALMRSAEVRVQVVAFRTDFQEASRQIDVLTDYADLHELLRHLELECYAVLAQDAEDFPDDEAATENITRCHIKLKILIDQMQDVAAHGFVAKPDTLWIQRLAALPDELDHALNTGDKKLLDRVLRRLRQVLDLQPSQINTRLSSTARSLRLSALVQALTRVQDSLIGLPDLDPDKRREFYAGMEALVTVNQTLAALIDDHDGWQAVDALLNRIDASIDQDTQELEMSWPGLKAQVEQLCHRQTDKRTLALLTDGKNLEAALAAGNPDRIRKAFLRYRSRAGELFYRVGFHIPLLCSELRKVGEPLASVLMMIQ